MTDDERVKIADMRLIQVAADKFQDHMNYMMSEYLRDRKVPKQDWMQTHTYELWQLLKLEMKDYERKYFK